MNRNLGQPIAASVSHTSSNLPNITGDHSESQSLSQTQLSVGNVSSSRGGNSISNTQPGNYNNYNNALSHNGQSRAVRGNTNLSADGNATEDLHNDSEEEFVANRQRELEEMERQLDSMEKELEDNTIDNRLNDRLVK